MAIGGVFIIASDPFSDLEQFFEGITNRLRSRYFLYAGACLACAWYFYILFRKMMNSRLAGIVAATAFWLIANYALYGYNEFSKNFEVVTDSNAYPEVVAKLGLRNDETFFPPAIPKTAKNVAFYYSPGALQGSTIISVSYQLSQEELLKIQKGIESSHREKTGDRGFFLYPVLMEENGKTITKLIGFPDDFTVYLQGYTNKEFDQKIAQNIDIPYSFTAISLSRSMIVYGFDGGG